MIVSIVAGVIISVAMGAVNMVNAAITFAIIIFWALALFCCFFGNDITGKIAKKTMEKHSKEAGFENYSTFITSAPFTVGGILRIDTNTGRIAYVSCQNPHEFQLISAKDITNIKSSYNKEIFGGTRYVYFEFYYNNKRVRIPTFTSRNSYHLQNELVLEGISKADAFCDILTRAQNSAV